MGIVFPNARQQGNGINPQARTGGSVQQIPSGRIQQWTALEG